MFKCKNVEVIQRKMDKRSEGDKIYVYIQILRPHERKTIKIEKMSNEITLFEVMQS